MSKKFKVLATDGFDKKAHEFLAADSRFEINVRKETLAAELLDFARDADFLIIRSATKLGAKEFELLPKLKGVVRAGVGIDNVDLESAKKSGVYVWNAPTGNFLATAEHAIGLIVSLFRAIPLAHSMSLEGKWGKKEISSLGRQISGARLGLFGAGNIGSRVAKIAMGLGMKVGIYDPYLKASPVDGAELLNLDQLLAQSDVISIHTPLSAETKNFFNLENLQKMKKGSYLVNAARGGIIVEKDLLKVLENEQLSGAALDVFEKEPFDLNNPVTIALLRNSRFISTPHVAASTKEAQQAVGLESAEKLKLVVDAVIKGKEELLPKALSNGIFAKFCS
jgi:D-3-phosphoglycerate dehydrogenase